jgi:curli biogenesis system outer membrane secretion channel CsgG
MTERAPHQPRPNRRYRRLVPTVVAVAALAAGTSFAASPARAAAGTTPAPPKRAHAHGPRTPSALVPRQAGATGPSTPGVGGS